jgi:hypothetical protein
MSRSVWLRRERDRKEADNDGTLVLSLASGHFDSLFPHEAPSSSFEDLFRRHYPDLRDLLNRHPHPGLALVAVSTEGVEGRAWLAAKDNDADAVILGRHSSAEIFLPADPRLSLRHLAVLLHPNRAETPVRFSVLDLRTPTAFTDEHGTARQAIESEGPVMVRCASVAFLLFPTQASTAPWPEDAAPAWARVPERLYFDPRAGGPPASSPERIVWPDAPGGWGDAPPRSTSITLVPTLPGPVFPSRDLAPSGSPRGELVVRSPAGQVSLRLGAGATRQGVLLGRYERCDTAGLPVLSSPSLSRVHLLVIEIAGALYAVDTASSNGSWVGPTSLRCGRLLPGQRVRLACDATVEWRVFH